MKKFLNNCITYFILEFMISVFIMVVFGVIDFILPFANISWLVKTSIMMSLISLLMAVINAYALKVIIKFEKRRKNYERKIN